MAKPDDGFMDRSKGCVCDPSDAFSFPCPVCDPKPVKYTKCYDGTTGESFVSNPAHTTAGGKEQQ